MAYDKKSLDDYVDVATRIAEFRDQYPEGRLRPADPAKPYEIKQVQGFDQGGDVIQQTFIVVVAAAFRDAGDTEPGIGMAWEVFPGRTSFTRGSELMNAETSAWGRAIIATLASDSRKGVASREEVRNRQAERGEDGAPRNRDGSLSLSRMSDEQRDQAGVMTREQTAEHSALKHDGQKTRRSQRLASTPDGDQFYGEPGPPLAPAEGVPGSASPDQLQKIGIRMGEAGITDRADRLKLVAAVAGREVASSKELSFTEAAAVLKELAPKTPATAGAGNG
jgi:hypothetical protein